MVFGAPVGRDLWLFTEPNFRQSNVNKLVLGGCEIASHRNCRAWKSKKKLNSKLTHYFIAILITNNSPSIFHSCYSILDCLHL